MEKRAYNRQKALGENLKFENVCSISSLYKAAFKSAKGVMFKESVQRYLLNLFSNLYRTRQELLQGKDVRLGFIEFDIVERGKARHIRSVHFRERVVQKSLCTNCLSPVLTYNLITDNGASQKGKGVHFALKRVVKFLKEHFNRYGNNGYALLIDFKSYFDNIEHAPIKSYIRKFIEEPQILKLSDDFIDAFGDKGLGLGSETSQINAVAYINEIDHYIKEKSGAKIYVRYMDDSIIIHHSKEFLEKLLADLKKKYAEYGITVNDKKSYITDLKHGFTFLKTRFFLTDTGKILRKACRDRITSERKKLKRLGKLFNEGTITQEAIRRNFDSWSGSMLHRNARKTVYTMTKLFNELLKRKE